MPFEFVCPFCHYRTKVDDKYAGQSGPCVSCSKTVTMPSYDERGILHPSIHYSSLGVNRTGLRANPILMLVVASVCFVACILLAGIAFYTFPLLQKRAIFAAQGRDIDNMKLIAQALNEYSDRYGTYPPSVVLGKSGQPLYSWRVLILPFLGYQDLYDEIQLDQPHDSASNLQVLPRMPREFASSTSDGHLNHLPNYSLIVGHGTLFPLTGPLSRENVDEPTLLLVETKHDFKNWMEPGDIDVSHGARPGNRPQKDLGGLYHDSFTAVSTSGDGFRFPNSVSGVVLDSLISPHGGEKVDVSSFR